MRVLDWGAPGRGSVITQDVQALRVDAAQETFGVSGRGIRIGIISDSFDAAPSSRDGGGYAADVASGDLPAGITVLDDLSEEEAVAQGARDEGRAMAQLIHDIAPGAELYFATGYGSERTFAQNIDKLVAADVDIIVDDVFYTGEPYFIDGLIAQAAAGAVANGVAYFSAAGNGGLAGITGDLDFSDVSGVSGRIHDWDSGPEFDPELRIGIAPNAEVEIVLTWADAFASASPLSWGATADLDLIFTVDGEPITLGWYRDIMGAAVFEENRAVLERLFMSRQGPIGLDTPLGAVVSNLGGNAIEFGRVFNPYDDRELEIGVQIEHVAGSTPSAFQLRAPTSASLVTILDDPGPDQSYATVFGHVAAEGVIGVGAVNYSDTPAEGVDPPVIEPFSARGDVTITHWPDGTPRVAPEIRPGVDFAATDGGNTTFLGDQFWWDTDGFPNFSGTSAAASNAAAIAALMLEVFPGLTPERILAAMQAGSVDMDDPMTPGFDTGRDTATGAGLIQADAIIAGLFNRIAAVSGAGMTNGTSLADLMIGTNGSDRLHGKNGMDMILAGAGDDLVFGNRARDTLRGGTGNDDLRGNQDADLILGQLGDDTLRGGAGHDELSGGAGRDRLRGGPGNDVLMGGADADRFVFDAGRDRILDFDPLEGDTLELRFAGQTRILTDFGAIAEFAGDHALRFWTTEDTINLRLNSTDRLTLEIEGGAADSLLVA